MILVTGANGNLGSQTINFLIEQNSSEKIAGLVRSEEKGADLKENGVNIRIGGYTDYTSLQEAMQNVDTILLISSSSLEGRVQQHENVIKTAEEAEVNHIFYTSIVHADEELSPLSPDHHKTEKILEEAGVDYTIYRHTFYGEFLPMYLGDALDTGEWYFPSGGQKINLALRSEMAEALANGLLSRTNHKNEVYEITSEQAYDLEEIADLISKETGKDITYHDLSIADFQKNLEKAGLPDETIVLSTSVATSFVNGALNYTHNTLGTLLGREPAAIEDFLPDVV